MCQCKTGCAQTNDISIHFGLVNPILHLKKVNFRNVFLWTHVKELHQGGAMLYKPDLPR